MSAVEIAAGGLPAPKWGAIPTRLWARAAPPWGGNSTADADWAAALAAAPQAVPHLKRPRETRQLRLVAGLVVAAHVALLLVLMRQAYLTPPAEQVISVELVRQMPEEPHKAADTPREVAQQQDKPARRQAEPDPPKPERQPQKQAQRRPPKPAPERAPDKPTAMPVVALPGQSANGADVVAYPQLVLSQVAKAKKQGRYMGVPGHAGVRFRLAEDGSLESVKLAMSSGDPILDIEAEAMVRRAAPFPPPPPGGRRDYGITLLFEARP